MKFIKAFKVAVLTLIVSAMIASCSITLPVGATSNPVGSKVGMASATIIMGFYFDADASIRTAAKNGNISKISTIDMKTEQYYFFMRVTTIVTGE